MVTTPYDVSRVVLAAALVLLVAGCATSASSGRPEEAQSHRVPPASAPPRAERAKAQLDRLVVRPRPRGTRGYQRDAFGSDWVDTDHNGCNQRDDVLLRDAVPRYDDGGTSGCVRPRRPGRHLDPYTGRTLRFSDLKDLRQAEAIQIDHVVPLAEAWVSGARHWSRSRREVFANDLEELIAVDGPTNMSKGDGDPAAWRPRKGYQCVYARRWTAIKTRYRLAVDASEKAALDQMLGTCSPVRA